MFGAYDSKHDPLGLKQPQSYLTVQPASNELVNSTNGSSSSRPSTGRQPNIGDDVTKNRKRKVSPTPSALSIDDRHVGKRTRLPSNAVVSTEQNNSFVDTRITTAPQNIDWSTLSFKDGLVLKPMERPYTYDDLHREIDEGTVSYEAPSSIAKSPPSRLYAQPPTPLSIVDSPGVWVQDADHYLAEYTPLPNSIPTGPLQSFTEYPQSQQYPPAELPGPNGWTNDMVNLFQHDNHTQVPQPGETAIGMPLHSAWVQGDGHYLVNYTPLPNSIPTEPFHNFTGHPQSQQSAPPAELPGPNRWTDNMVNLFQHDDYTQGPQPGGTAMPMPLHGAWVQGDGHYLADYTPLLNSIPTEPFQSFTRYPQSQQSPPPAELPGPNGWTGDMVNLFQQHDYTQVPQPQETPRDMPLYWHPLAAATPFSQNPYPYPPTPPQDVQFLRPYDLIPPPRYPNHGLPAPPPSAQYHHPYIGLPGPPPSRIPEHSQQHQPHPSVARPFPSQATGQHQQHTHSYPSQAATGPQASSSSTSITPTTAPLPTASSVRYTDVPIKISGPNRPRSQLLLKYPKFSNQFKDRFVLREIILTPQQQSEPRPCPLGANCTAQVKISGLQAHIAEFHEDPARPGRLTCHGHHRRTKVISQVGAMARHVLQEHWKVAQFECAYCGTRTRNVQGDMVDHWMNCDQLISLHANYRVQ